jgi:hypothetical protein
VTRDLLLSGFLVFLLSAGYLSCVKEGVHFPEDIGDAYYPLVTGKFLEYRVDSIIFDDAGFGNSTDTITAYIRETVGEQKVDGAGDTIFILERRWRRSADDPWLLTNLFTAGKNQFEAIRQEGNLRFQVFTFPLDKTRRWRMTSYINPQVDVPVGSESLEVYNFWESRVLSYDSSGVAGDFAFDAPNLMVVSQASNDDDPLHLRVVRETYVRNVGLVSRDMEILDSRCIRLGDPSLCAGQSWDEKAEKGFKLRQVLVNYN